MSEVRRSAAADSADQRYRRRQDICPTTPDLCDGLYFLVDSDSACKTPRRRCLGRAEEVMIVPRLGGGGLIRRTSSVADIELSRDITRRRGQRLALLLTCALPWTWSDRQTGKSCRVSPDASTTLLNFAAQPLMPTTAPRECGGPSRPNPHAPSPRSSTCAARPPPTSCPPLANMRRSAKPNCCIMLPDVLARPHHEVRTALTGPRVQATCRPLISSAQLLRRRPVRSPFRPLCCSLVLPMSDANALARILSEGTRRAGDQVRPCAPISSPSQTSRPTPRAVYGSAAAAADRS